MNVKLLLLATCIAATALFWGSSAIAATVVKMDLESLVVSSDTIVVAEVQSVEAAVHSDGRVYSTITLHVDEVLKGDVEKSFAIRQIGGRDRANDVATHVPGMPYFAANEQVVLFLTDRAEGTPVVTGMSQGKFQLATGPDGQTRYAVPQLHGVHLIDPPGEHQPASGDLAERHAGLFQQVHEFSSFRQRILTIVEAQEKGSPQ